MKITLSILKADVGSIGGHTKPSEHMMEAVRSDATDAIKSGLLIDSFVGHTGDDICIVASHTHGADNTDVHQFAWDTFFARRRHRQSIRAVRSGPGPIGRRSLGQHPGRRAGGG